MGEDVRPIFLEQPPAVILRAHRHMGRLPERPMGRSAIAGLWRFVGLPVGPAAPQKAEKLLKEYGTPLVDQMCSLCVRRIVAARSRVCRGTTRSWPPRPTTSATTWSSSTHAASSPPIRARRQRSTQQRPRCGAGAAPTAMSTRRHTLSSSHARATGGAAGCPRAPPDAATDGSHRHGPARGREAW